MLAAAILGITLASSSPRRNQLLAVLGIPFAVSPTDVAELRLGSESPAEMVVRLSLAKARAAAVGPAHAIVLGSDTAVTLGNGEGTTVFGKPNDRDDLQRMLVELGGREHIVYTGFAVLDRRDGRTTTGFQTVPVRLRRLGEVELAAYVESGIGDDKAGGYAIQDQVFQLVESLRGCAAAAMGLPLCGLLRGLPRFGFHLPAATDVETGCRALTGMGCCLADGTDCPELRFDA